MVQQTYETEISEIQYLIRMINSLSRKELTIKVAYLLVVYTCLLLSKRLFGKRIVSLENGVVALEDPNARDFDILIIERERLNREIADHVFGDDTLILPKDWSKHWPEVVFKIIPAKVLSLFTTCFKEHPFLSFLVIGLAIYLQWEQILSFIQNLINSIRDLIKKLNNGQ